MILSRKYTLMLFSGRDSREVTKRSIAHRQEGFRSMLDLSRTCDPTWMSGFVRTRCSRSLFGYFLLRIPAISLIPNVTDIVTSVRLVGVLWISMPVKSAEMNIAAKMNGFRLGSICRIKG